MGPPLHSPNRGALDVKSRLYEITGRETHLIRSPDGQPFHTDLLPFDKKDPITTVMLDFNLTDGTQLTDSPSERARADEIHELVRVFRHTCGLSSRLSFASQRFLPPIPEALEGISHFVLASDRLADDVDGQRALRGWVERGGHLWVPVDRVSQKTISALLGDVTDLQIVDRISLTSIRFDAASANSYLPSKEAREFEKPVDFVRVLVPEQQVFYTIDGWPAVSAAVVGRGRVLFTMLGASGWIRPRTSIDQPSKFWEFPALPVAISPFQYFSDELQVQPERPLIPVKDLKEFVSDQISYKVVDRGVVALVFGTLFISLVVASFVLARREFLEHLGWLGPALAVVAAAAFVGLGNYGRSAVPPMLAVIQLVNGVSGTDTAQASGYFGAYHPDRSTASIGGQDGGEFDLDLAGLEGRVYSRVQTDFDSWHWESLELPAGVRTASFKYTIQTRAPIEASIRFGPEGIEGRVDSGPFHQLEDLLLSAPGQRALPVALAGDGSFKAGLEDAIQSGQLIGGGLLSDRQRTRQALYEKLLADPQPQCLSSRTLLLGWALPVDMHFTLAPSAPPTGAALLMAPVVIERPAPDSLVTVPTAFVDCQRLGNDGHYLPTTAESRFGTNVRLRFQVPPEVMPLTVNSARLTLKLRAALREVTVNGFAGNEALPLRRLSSPAGVEQIEIIDPRVLQLDKEGALFVSLDIGDVRSEATRDQWHLDWVGLEVRGRTTLRNATN
jgi:hypothetical protein